MHYNIPNHSGVLKFLIFDQCELELLNATKDVHFSVYLSRQSEYLQISQCIKTVSK